MGGVLPERCFFDYFRLGLIWSGAPPPRARSPDPPTMRCVPSISSLSRFMLPAARHNPSEPVNGVSLLEHILLDNWEI